MVILHREPPPAKSKPEAIDLQSKKYAMSEDLNLFQPPESYPKPPSDTYYQIPATKPEPKKLTRIFPWEDHVLKPTRVFPGEFPTTRTGHREQDSSSATAGGDGKGSPLPTEESMISHESDRSISWGNCSIENAWDEVPEIRRYADVMQQRQQQQRQQRRTNTHPFTPDNFSISLGKIDIGSGAIASGIPNLAAELIESANLPRVLQERGYSGQDRQQVSIATAGTALGAEEEENATMQKDWMDLTVDMFVHVLQATSLCYDYTKVDM